MTFAFPLALLLLPAPLIVYAAAPPRRAGAAAVAVPPAIAESMLPWRGSGAAAHARRWTPALIWMLLLLALAGPREKSAVDLLPASGRDVMFVLDLSGSMLKPDFTQDGRPASRLDAVKQVAAGFVRGRRGDRVGLIVFGDRAFVAAPLTHDVEAVARAIETAAVGVSGESTAISDGLGLAIKRLRRSEAKSRVAILLSDGVDTTGTVDPVAAAAIAATLEVRVHAIALGPEDLASAPSSRDAVDAATLRRIATESGGEMFRVRDARALRDVAAAIDALEPSPSQAPPLEVWREYWTWPAGAAFALALALLLLGREAEA